MDDVATHPVARLVPHRFDLAHPVRRTSRLRVQPEGASIDAPAEAVQAAPRVARGSHLQAHRSVDGDSLREDEIGKFFLRGDV